MKAPSPSKAALWQALAARLSEDLDALRHAQRETQKAATHEEAKPENDKDTRALEQSYLARGQAVRVEELTQGVASVIALPLRDFAEDAPIALGALVTLENDEGSSLRVLLSPAGAGLRLSDAEGEVRVITAASPLGKALVGARAGDSPEYVGPAGTTAVTVLSVE